MSFYCTAALLQCEYVYQVGYDQKTDTTYYIHQIDPLCIDLYLRIGKKGEYQKLLPNYFNPAGFRLLPSNTAFSFIHNDAVYVKQFAKRSPKRIEFLDPIYGINAIEWINDETFYCAACEYGRYRIYESTIDGELTTIVSDDSFDALWPNKCGKTLFYIRRDVHNAYIVETAYDPEKRKQETSIAKNEDVPIIYLIMHSDVMGFFLTHKNAHCADQTVFVFSCHLLQKNDSWSVKPLFDFLIPRKLLVEGSKARLYESIMPLRPVYSDGNVHFFDTQDGEKMIRRTYELQQKQSATKAHSLLDNPGKFERNLCSEEK